MPFRLLQYMVEIWRSYAKDLNITNKEFRLPVIVPCVLYNGQKKWTACQSFGDYQKGFQFFKEHALDFRYLLIDVKRYRQEKLFALDNLMAKVFFIEQFPSFTEILKGIKEIAPTLSKLPTEDTDKFLAWSSHILTKGLPREQSNHIKSVLADNSKEVGTMITNAERIITETRRKERAQAIAEGRAEGLIKGITEGRAEGKAEGTLITKKLIARNALKSGLSVQQVAEISELPLEEVILLNEELA